MHVPELIWAALNGMDGEIRDDEVADLALAILRLFGVELAATGISELTRMLAERGNIPAGTELHDVTTALAQLLENIARRRPLGWTPRTLFAVLQTAGERRETLLHRLVTRGEGESAQAGELRSELTEINAFLGNPVPIADSAFGQPVPIAEPSELE